MLFSSWPISRAQDQIVLLHGAGSDQIELLRGAGSTWPVVARGQQAKIPRIGNLDRALGFLEKRTANKQSEALDKS
jgi:hypothetical protein